MNMNREPADAYFIENNKYLPYLNNLNHCNNTDSECESEKLRRKANFLRLKSAHFFASPNDGVVAPWQHSLLQRYTPVDSIDEIETKFEEFTVMGMEETVEYKEDTYGLRTLDERGALHRTTVANVSHNCWIVDGVRFDANVECYWEPVPGVAEQHQSVQLIRRGLPLDQGPPQAQLPATQVRLLLCFSPRRRRGAMAALAAGPLQRGGLARGDRKQVRGAHGRGHGGHGRVPAAGHLRPAHAGHERRSALSDGARRLA
ncbi:unnamed protein product [Phytophthora fragariaefolia]|uniref:Unnamed protein product n=1 Tax=Phytophthora fragariaefolia TaxID=1490495 RepID=A0A9W7CTL8_9STRA|nr:unnamed protein product [Phytophthora fragariaefolia]